jgi:Siphovirus Gp157
MANELVRTQANSCTLYVLEDTLAAFTNTIDLPPDDATRQLVLDEIGQALRKAKDKRDGVVAFLRHCEQQQAFAEAEIERIERRKEFIARVQEELERYVVQVIEQFAMPDRRGIKRLEGNVSTLRIQKNADSVLITDAVAIPLAQKDVVLTMPAYVWEALLQIVGAKDRGEFESRVERLEYKPDKRAIAADLKNGVAVPGADLKFGDWRLVIG